ncbi:MAG: hypothetical protein AABX48_00190 [Nanoarchaeota archaeon]
MGWRDLPSWLKVGIVFSAILLIASIFLFPFAYNTEFRSPKKDSLISIVKISVDLSLILVFAFPILFSIIYNRKLKDSARGIKYGFFIGTIFSSLYILYHIFFIQQLIGRVYSGGYKKIWMSICESCQFEILSVILIMVVYLLVGLFISWVVGKIRNKN